MGFFDRFRSNKRKEEVGELMKSLCLDFVGDIFNIALERGEIPMKSIDIYEPMILGMFLITIAYRFKHGDSQKTQEQYGIFYRAMENNLCDIHIKAFKDKNITKTCDTINTMIFVIRNSADLRFGEYMETIKEDYQKRPLIMKTIRAFAKHLFSESIDEDKSHRFAVVASEIFLFHMNRCIGELK